MENNILDIKNLHNIIIDKLYECGCVIIFIKHINKNPLEITVKYNNNELNLRIFIWNITHGGKTRSEDEFRVQIKIPKNYSLNYNDILLGWYRDEVFVGYDTSKHLKPAWSSSLQIKKSILEEAYKKGYKTYENKNDETVIAFNPYYLGIYIENHKEIHSIIEENSLTKKDVNNVNDIISERKIIYQTIKKKIRAADFRKKVLGAYSNKCCFCNLQLNITEAAHILPVSQEKSSDEVQNGICLCPNHHKAYEYGLIYINEKYQIISNKEYIKKLKCLKLDGGLEEFIKNTRSIILLPNNKKDYPNTDYIKSANKCRLNAV